MARRPARRPAASPPHARLRPTPAAAPAQRTRKNRRGLLGAAGRKADSRRSAWPRSRGRLAFRSTQLRGEFARVCDLGRPHQGTSTAPCSAQDLSDMAEEPPRERLFDVLMRRLEALAPHRDAVRSLLRSARRNPPLALRAQWPRCALPAMDADRRRYQRLRPARHDARARSCDACSARCCAPGSTTTTPGLPAPWLRSTARWPAASAFCGFLDDLCYIPSRICRLRPRRRRRYEEDSEEPEAA